MKFRVAQLRLHWVTACKVGLPEASKPVRKGVHLERRRSYAFDGHPADDAWDVICFDFDTRMASLKTDSAGQAPLTSTPILMLTLQNSMDLALWAPFAVFDMLVKPLSAEE